MTLTLSPSTAGEELEKVSTRCAKWLAATSWLLSTVTDLGTAKPCAPKHSLKSLEISIASARPRPEAPRLVVFVEPGIVAVGSGAWPNRPRSRLGGNQPLEQCCDRVAVHPVQGAADGDDIERTNIGWQRLGRAFDQGETLPDQGCRCPRGLQHCRFGIGAVVAKRPTPVR
jgi:hypothetical protein